MRICCLLAALLSLTLGTARADFAVGLAAYDGGDYAAALGAWRPLARHGDADAQIALAGLYMQGYGVAQNPSLAAQWYRRAARQGAPLAQLNLGDLYARGLGVNRDLVTAYAWLYLAAGSGQVWAENRLSILRQQLSSERIREALTLAPQLAPMH